MKKRRKRKWHDVDDVIHVSVLPDRLKKIDKEMRKKPCFEHSKEVEEYESGRTNKRP